VIDTKRGDHLPQADFRVLIRTFSGRMVAEVCEGVVQLACSPAKKEAANERGSACLVSRSATAENSVDVETHLSSSGRMNHDLRTVRSLASLASSWNLVKNQLRQVVERWLQDCPPAWGPQGASCCPSGKTWTSHYYRGRNQGNQSPILAIALAAEQPSPQTLRRLEHEYSLAAELDAHSAC
jgi:hypothetical protein